ncbi:DNA-binding transcriptional regulator, LysR family [Paenibacillus sp. UNC496MF]|uniref:LysR family transcriptional regulator n=1 Tax=Paenibacillus sp. UNC496MF TaxID=1502753 RepID=UPI0008E5AAFB|nr:LysR family transcriptional regulator [Paenibacillus sp. UNC496MF]SFJ44622.1 DNA-binding transcriptional regulator, LysR family [Paenibacillus sp. UNC496MF]
MELNLERYRVFYWTAKLGSLTKAADKLHITQPAVSHTLKQLEGVLGGQLFFRTTKGVTLTAEGEVLFNFVEQAMHYIEIGEKKIAEMQELSYGEISIGASDTLCKHFLLPHLEQFHKQYPEIKIRVTNRTTPETISLLKEGKIDFGVVNLPAFDLKIDFRISSTLQDCLVGNQEYAVLAENPLPLEDLHQYPLLLLEGGNTRNFLDEYAASSGITLKPELELGSLDLLTQFAQSGFGLTFIAREYISDELSTGKLIEIPLIPSIPKRHIGFATLKAVPLSAASRRFLEFLL